MSVGGRSGARAGARGVLIVVPPTVGHVNHGIALAGVVQEAGRTPVLVTGSAAAPHLEALRPAHPFHCLTSHDLPSLDRSDPRRKPHLEQLCAPETVRPALRDLRALAERYAAALVIGKDYFAAVLAAAACGIPYAAYYTDGIEAVLKTTTRQTVTDPEGLTARLRSVAEAEGIAVSLRPVPETLRSDELNIVRGFPRTAAVPPAAWRPYEPAIAFTGALTYDAPPAELDRWDERLAALRPPLYWTTFGTVLRDRTRFAALLAAARQVPGTWLVADPDGDLAAPLPPGLVPEPYVPNAAALRHAAVVIHHGGYGTTLSALTAGVPQLVIPDNPRTQQRTHGEVLRTLGVGSLLDAESLAGEGVAAGPSAGSGADPSVGEGAGAPAGSGVGAEAPAGAALAAAVVGLDDAAVRGRAQALAGELAGEDARLRAELRERIARLAAG